MKNIFYILVAMFFLLNTSCKHTGAANNKANLSDSLLAKKISIPNELVLFQQNKFVKMDTLEFVDKKKIISIVDGNCVKCVVKHLNAVDSIFQSIIPDDDTKMIFILNVDSRDSAYFMRNLSSYINAEGYVLWDANYNFERQNKLFTPDRNLRTFLTNKEGQIVLYGNPVLNPKVLDFYKDKLYADLVSPVN